MKLEHATTEMLLFRQKRQDVGLLYDLFFEYVSVEVGKGKPSIPDRFTLTAAFACVFDHDLKLVSGLCSFTPAVHILSGRIILRFLPHHWLSWHDENHIIDVLPLDGMYGVSVPQAIVQRREMMRYFPSKGIFPTDWDDTKKASFDNSVSDVVAILEELMEKVPF